MANSEHGVGGDRISRGRKLLFQARATQTMASVLYRQAIEKERPFVVPDFRETELRNAVEKLSGDLCISRPKSRLGWGIELPFDQRLRELRLVRRA